MKLMHVIQDSFRNPAMIAVVAVALLSTSASSQTQLSCTARPPDCAVYSQGIKRDGCLPTRYLKKWIQIAEFTYGPSQIGYTIYLPPEYATNPTQRFPVIYYLDGVGGGAGSGYPGGWMGQIIADAGNTKKMPPFIFVWAEAGGAGSYMDWGCCFGNSTYGPDVMNTPDMENDSSESFIIKELIPYIDGKYRTIASKQGRSIEGFSMGGYGCLHLAYKYPDMFSSVLSYACSIDERSPGYPAANHAGHMDPIIRNIANKDKVKSSLKIRLRTGSDDANNLFYQWRHHKVLDSLQIPHVADTIKGTGHDAAYLYAQAETGGTAGLNDLKWHAASWTTTAVASPGSRPVSALQTAPKNIRMISGSVPCNDPRFASAKAFDIRGTYLGSVNESLGAKSNQRVAVRIIRN